MSVSSHLQNLNAAQLEAVTHFEGPLLIFAGAGSGKTRVLTHRIAHLVLEHQIHPERILAVTFTNKAAQEMRHRVMSLFQGIHEAPAPSWVSTFHSTCVRILRAHAKLLDFTPQFAIYDSSDSGAVLKRVYQKLNIDPKIIDLRSVRNRIDRAKNDYRFSDSIRTDRYMPETFANMVADIYDAYQEELRVSNAMDFGDLICNVVTLFKLEPTILERYQQGFQHFLVDEYQDTNKVQYMLVKMLSEKSQNICVVGDDDQSIYAFRGATIENILNFRKDFPDTKVVTLDLNYRSTKNILTAANSIIGKNKKRQKKTMRTDNPAGKGIVCFRAFDEKAEASFVTREIVALRKEGMSLKDIALFYRTNAQSRALEEALCEANLPYEIYGGHRFYDRKEIKDILAYFRLVINPNDSESFLRIINVPARGLGATSVGNLVAFADKKKLSLLAALELALQENAPCVSSANRGKFSKFLEILNSLRESHAKCEAILSDLSVPAASRVSALPGFLKSIADETEYLQRLKAEDTLEAEGRIENIYELLAVAGDFSHGKIEQGITWTLNDFLDRASLSSDADQENKGVSGEKTDTGSISLMTLHLAKGLEFDCVFLVGLEEGILPHVRSMNEDKDLEEERRLCYVGITRARKRLYLTRASSRQMFGWNGGLSGIPSRFIADLPPKLVEDRQTGFLEFHY